MISLRQRSSDSHIPGQRAPMVLQELPHALRRLPAEEPYDVRCHGVTSLSCVNVKLHQSSDKPWRQHSACQTFAQRTSRNRSEGYRLAEEV